MLNEVSDWIAGSSVPCDQQPRQRTGPVPLAISDPRAVDRPQARDQNDRADRGRHEAANEARCSEPDHTEQKPPRIEPITPMIRSVTRLELPPFMTWLASHPAARLPGATLVVHGDFPPAPLHDALEPIWAAPLPKLSLRVELIARLIPFAAFGLSRSGCRSHGAVPPTDAEAGPRAAVVQQALVEGGRPQGQWQTPPGVMTLGCRRNSR